MVLYLISVKIEAWPTWIQRDVIFEAQCFRPGIQFRIPPGLAVLAQGADVAMARGLCADPSCGSVVLIPGLGGPAHNPSQLGPFAVGLP